MAVPHTFGDKSSPLHTGNLDEDFAAVDAADVVQQQATTTNAQSVAALNQALQQKAPLGGYDASINTINADITDLQAQIDGIISQLSSQTGLTISTAPALSDLTPDGGQVLTITPGTYTATPQSRTWEGFLDGQYVQTVGSAAITCPVVSGAGHIFWVEELAVNPANGVTTRNPSGVATINTPAAVPVKSSPHTIVGNVAPGQTVVLTSGSYSPAVYGSADAYTFTLRTSAGTIVAGPTAQAGATLNYGPIPSNLAGAGLVLWVRGKNAAGSELAETPSVTYLVSGAVAPDYTAPSAEQPGWVAQTAYAVGTPMTLDCGMPANNPTSWDYQIRRDEADITGVAGMSGNTTTRLVPITPVAADGGKQLSARVLARNAAAPIAASTAYAAAVLVDVAGGAGATGSFSYNGATLDPGWNGWAIDTLGTFDWKVNNNATESSMDRKSGTSRITFTTFPRAAAGGGPLITWSSGGTPNASGSAAAQSGLIDYLAPGDIDVYGDTTLRTVHFLVVDWAGTVNVTVTPSDASFAPQTFQFSTSGTDPMRISCSHKMDSTGTVKYSFALTGPASNLWMGGVALST